MSRQFSVIRRAPQLIDILTPFVYGITEYRIKYAANFDASFTQIIAAPRNGYLDPTVSQAILQSAPGNNVRITFDPTNSAYSIAAPSSSMWLQLTRYDGSSEVYVSPPTLLLPFEANQGIGVTTIAGSAPSGATSADALQVDLPFLATDMRVRATGSHPVCVSTELNGAETIVANGEIGQYIAQTGMISSLFVRGSGGTAPFALSFTRAYPK